MSNFYPYVKHYCFPYYKIISPTRDNVHSSSRKSQHQKDHPNLLNRVRAAKGLSKSGNHDNCKALPDSATDQQVQKDKEPPQSHLVATSIATTADTNNNNSNLDHDDLPFQPADLSFATPVKEKFLDDSRTTFKSPKRKCPRPKKRSATKVEMLEKLNNIKFAEKIADSINIVRR